VFCQKSKVFCPGGGAPSPVSAFADTDDWDAYMRICIAREDEILERAVEKIKGVLK
jgi:hypothetical protein